MKPFIQDGHNLVLRAVRALSGSTTRLVVEAITTTDWASATFVGKHHRCELRVEGSLAEVERAVTALTSGLPDVDVGACGYFLADCVLDRIATRSGADGAVADIVIEALTIEE